MKRSWFFLGFCLVESLWSYGGLAEVRVFPAGYLSLSKLRQAYPDINHQLTPLLDSIVRVRLINSNQQQVGAATGTIVQGPEGMVLQSAFHIFKPLFSPKGECLGGPIRVWIEERDGKQTEELSCKSFLGRSRTSAKADVVTFSVSKRWKGISNLMAASLETGDEILATGFPEIVGNGMVVSMGHVLTETTHDSSRTALTSASASPGMSGAPVFKIMRDGRPELVGHLAYQLMADSVASVSVRFRWGEKDLRRGICLSQADFNGILYNGSHTEISFKARLLKTIQHLLKRNECNSSGWQWQEGLQQSVRSYRDLVDLYAKKEGEEPGILCKQLSSDYLKLLVGDDFKAVKMADFPVITATRSADSSVSLNQFREILGQILMELDQFEEKIHRIEQLFPKSTDLEEWLRAIGELDLEHRLAAVNDYYLFGLGGIKVW